jgi:hypothetical protein
VDGSDRQDGRRQCKSDPLDAVRAARAAQSGRARGAPKGRDGAVEAIRALMVAKRSAAGERTRTINQARPLILTGPDDLRAQFTKHTTAALVAGIASLRPLWGARSRPMAVTWRDRCGVAVGHDDPPGHLPRREKAVQLPVAGYRDLQPAPPLVLPAGASSGSTVLPGTMRLPPAARVTSTRRAWLFGDAGMVTCRTPSA